jgi:hypothetical protein
MRIARIFHALLLCMNADVCVEIATLSDDLGKGKVDGMKKCQVLGDVKRNNSKHWTIQSNMNERIASITPHLNTHLDVRLHR